MDMDDWRTQLQPDCRQRIVNKIIETLKRHIPFTGEAGLMELKKIAVRFEEKTYAAATSQTDYLRKISLKILTMGTKSQSTITNSLPPESADSSNAPPDFASLELTAQTEHANEDDWQEEVYQKIKAMKEMYLPELNEIYQKIATKLHQHDSLPQQPKSEQLEKVKVFKTMLECITTFLQVSKENVMPGCKEKLGSYEKQIINFINTNRPRKPVPSMQQGQLPPPQGPLPPSQMHSMQQPQSQITQVQSHENQMNPQLQSMNLQGSVATMQQNNMKNLQHNSLSSLYGVPIHQQNTVNPVQPGSDLDSERRNASSSFQQAAVGSLQQNPLSVPQQAKTNTLSQSGVNVLQPTINSLQSNSNMFKCLHLKQQEAQQLLQTQQIGQLGQPQLQQDLFMRQLILQHQQQQLLHQQQQLLHQQANQHLPEQLQPHQMPQLHQIHDVNDLKKRLQLLSLNTQNNIAFADVQSSAGLPFDVFPAVGIIHTPISNTIGQNSNMQNISGTSQDSLVNSMGEGMPSNIFASSPRLMHGMQEVPYQQAPQQFQTPQEFLCKQQILYQQQRQKALLKQKFEQSLTQSNMQPQQQQQILSQPIKLQQSGIKTSSAMLPSAMQSAVLSTLQQLPQQAVGIHQQQSIMSPQQQQQLMGRMQTNQHSIPMLHQPKNPLKQMFLIKTERALPETSSSIVLHLCGCLVLFLLCFWLYVLYVV